MADVEQPVILKAAVLAKEAAPTLNPVLTGNQKELADFLRSQRAADNPETTLKLMAGKATPRNVALAMLDQALGTQTSLRVDATGMKDRVTNPTPTFEKNEFDESRTKLMDIYDAVEKGSISRYERNEILSTLYRDDVYRDILKKIHPTLDTDMPRMMNQTLALSPGLISIIDSIARQPEFKQKIADILAQRFDPARRKEGDNVAVDQLKQELAELQADLKNRAGGGTGAQAKLEQIQDDLKDYGMNVVGGVLTPMPRRQELIDAKQAMDNASADFTPVQSQYNLLKQQSISNASNGQVAQNALNQLQNVEPDFLLKKAKFTQAEAQFNALKAEETRKEQERDKLIAAVDQKKKRLRDVEKELATANPNKRVEDQSLMADVDTIYRDATIEALNERLQQAEARYQELSDEKKKKESEALDKKLEENLKEKWFTTRPRNQLFFVRFGEKEVVVDKKAVLQDYRDYIVNGPESLMREVMEADVEAAIRKKYGVTTLTPAMRTEVDAKIKQMAKDKGREAVLRMLVQARRTGKEFSMTDVVRIEELNPDVFQEMIERDRELKRRADQLAQTEAIDPVSNLPRSFLRRHFNHALDSIGGTWQKATSDDRVDVH